jgi:cytoskeletal protein CcmA (bactofilin family)
MENSNVDTIIGVNVLLKGNLKNKGSIQINGTIEGEVRSDDNLFVGDTAKIKGPVVAKTIEVSGEIRGLVEATEKLELNPTGRIIGDINAKSLIIKQGATFVGKSIMPSSETGDDHKAETKKEEKEEEKEEAAILDQHVEHKTEDKFGFFKK